MAESSPNGPAVAQLETAVLPVDVSKISLIPTNISPLGSSLDDWTLDLDEGNPDAQNLRRAARELRNSDVPVAFPTETVYGLGADATRSAAVRGIFRAKNRPPDNPLIVHIHSLNQLRDLLDSSPPQNVVPSHSNGQDIDQRNTRYSQLQTNGEKADPIPEIYKPLIEQFWPGPLTLIFRKPASSCLAPEVTAGLQTFGARMPSNALALALIKLADVPVAAPSANASSKPSPTAAEHVKYDLEGRISTILDGGPCAVGVESTVVDGLSDPPTILRPGGISFEQIRACPGWERVTKGYKEASESQAQPRAPGMKYRHYSPKAPVVLFEYQNGMPTAQDMLARLSRSRRVGIIRTKTWPVACGLQLPPGTARSNASAAQIAKRTGNNSPGTSGPQSRVVVDPLSSTERFQVRMSGTDDSIDISEISLGRNVEKIGQGLFAALRQLDQDDVDVIFVEGIDEREGHVAAAVMNRLRKAAEVKEHA